VHLTRTAEGASDASSTAEEAVSVFARGAAVLPSWLGEDPGAGRVRSNPPLGPSARDA